MAFDMSLVIKREGPTPPYKLVYQRGPNRSQASVHTGTAKVTQTHVTREECNVIYIP